MSFLVPTIYSAWCFNWPYALLALNLYASSQLYHSRYCTPSYVYDQVSIFALWLYGSYILYPHPVSTTLPYWLLSVYMGIVFYYGKRTNTMAFHPVHRDWWHTTIHYAGTLGMIITQHILNSA